MIKLSIQNYKTLLDICTPSLEKNLTERPLLQYIALEAEGNKVTAFGLDGFIMTGCHLPLEERVPDPIQCLIPAIKPPKCDRVIIAPEKGKVTITFADRHDDPIQISHQPLTGEALTLEKLTKDLRWCESSPVYGFDGALLQRLGKALGKFKPVKIQFVPQNDRKLPLMICNVAHNDIFAMMMPMRLSDDSDQVDAGMFNPSWDYNKE